VSGATQGLDVAPAVDPGRYAMGGRPPRAALRPASAQQAAEALRVAARDRLAVVPWGGGVGLAHDDGAPRYDLALDLTGLDAIVEYDPEDLTLTAQCGVTVAAHCAVRVRSSGSYSTIASSPVRSSARS